ncbi:immunoglobulin domain-containing protein [Vibrio jasicida]|uniref:immunoglobulin domain-containing protein n=1 Tax=Vibrio jasicida TaxID=766224 RepID=UPI0005EEDC8A|nr:immunoglobulin domain-containing protein [Vibrio jasicida]
MAPPTITVHPEGGVQSIGSTITLTAQAKGTEPMMWSFKKDGVEVASGRGFIATYSKQDTQLSDAGSYSCVFTNALGSVTTNIAKISYSPSLSITVGGDSHRSGFRKDDFGTLIQIDSNLFDDPLTGFYVSSERSYPVAIITENRQMLKNHPTLMCEILFDDGSIYSTSLSYVNQPHIAENFYIQGVIDPILVSKFANNRGKNIDVYLTPPNIDYDTFDSDFVMTIGQGYNQLGFAINPSYGSVVPNKWKPDIDPNTNFLTYEMNLNEFDFSGLFGNRTTKWNGFDAVKIEYLSDDGYYLRAIHDKFGTHPFEGANVSGYIQAMVNYEIFGLFKESVGKSFKVKISNYVP